MPLLDQIDGVIGRHVILGSKCTLLTCQQGETGVGGLIKRQRSYAVRHRQGFGHRQAVVVDINAIGKAVARTAISYLPSLLISAMASAVAVPLVA